MTYADDPNKVLTRADRTNTRLTPSSQLRHSKEEGVTDSLPNRQQLQEIFMENEVLTRDLIRSHLFSAIEITSQEQRDGVVRWAWCLSPLGRCPPNDNLHRDEDRHYFKSRESATRFALGWVRRNRPDLEAAAVREAKEGIAYRAKQMRAGEK
jgi:hypothetical protein